MNSQMLNLHVQDIGFFIKTVIKTSPGNKSREGGVLCGVTCRLNALMTEVDSQNSKYDEICVSVTILEKKKICFVQFTCHLLNLLKIISNTVTILENFLILMTNV